MTVTEFIYEAVGELNRTSLREVGELTADQFRWTPTPQANPIWFILWHFIRGQDYSIHRFQQQPSLWEREGWHQRMGMDQRDLGGPFSAEDINQMTPPSPKELVAYVERVMEASLAYLQTLDEDQLSHVPNPERTPVRTVGMTISNVVLGHGWSHLGEIRYIKGLQGLPGYA